MSVPQYIIFFIFRSSSTLRGPCRTLGHVGEGDVYLAWSPLAHAFGFTLNVFPMFLGAVVVFQEPNITFREFKNVLETRHVSSLLVVRSTGKTESFLVQRAILVLTNYPKINKLLEICHFY